MRCPTVLSCSPWILALCVLGTLPLCACAPQTQLVYQDRIVKEPVPTLAPLDPKLTVDCPPDSDIPAGAVTIAVLITRLASVEGALTMCRTNMARIRDAMQPLILDLNAAH